jgi:hypothetical protein
MDRTTPVTRSIEPPSLVVAHHLLRGIGLWRGVGDGPLRTDWRGGLRGAGSSPQLWAGTHTGPTRRVHEKRGEE